MERQVSMISMEVTKGHLSKLEAMCRKTGMSRSALLRLLIDRSELIPRYSVRVSRWRWRRALHSRGSWLHSYKCL